MGAGIAPARAYDLAVLIRRRLTPKEARAIESTYLNEIIAAVLAEAEGAQAVERFARLNALHGLDMPVILLIGGTTGTGKSAIAAEVAHRLGITRVTSTDFLRQTLRAIIPSEVAPSLHLSSFDAGRAVTCDGSRSKTVIGFLAQARHVRVAVDAVLNRAHEERLSMVLEGVHLVPEQRARPADAIVVSCLVTISGATDHARRFHSRDRECFGRRPADKYVAALPEIRRIDEYLRATAEAAGVPVIENQTLEAAVDRVIDLVLGEVDAVTARPGEPELAPAFASG
jgi:2-phosphoglycerate kinase